MRRSLLGVVITLLAAGCATLDGDERTLCYGVRRPANSFGSVLAPGLEPTGTATAPPAPGGSCGHGL